MPVTVKDLGEVLVAGNDYTITLTLTKDGATYDITGATITCTARPINREHTGFSDHSVAITTAASGIATLTLTDTETNGMLATNTNPDITKSYTFYCDVKVVESGANVLHCGPFKMEVRYPGT